MGYVRWLASLQWLPQDLVCKYTLHRYDVVSNQNKHRVSILLVKNEALTLIISTHTLSIGVCLIGTISVIPLLLI